MRMYVEKFLQSRSQNMKIAVERLLCKRSLVVGAKRLKPLGYALADLLCFVA